MGEVGSAEKAAEAPAAQPWTSYIPAVTGMAALMAAIALAAWDTGRRSRRCSF
jgi:hypothetical protein